VVRSILAVLLVLALAVTASADRVPTSRGEDGEQIGFKVAPGIEMDWNLGNQIIARPVGDVVEDTLSSDSLFVWGPTGTPIDLNIAIVPETNLSGLRVCIKEGTHSMATTTYAWGDTLFFPTSSAINVFRYPLAAANWDSIKIWPQSASGYIKVDFYVWAHTH
jgi:hypothetical protein